MKSTTILWVDDEIDMLTPHILFFREKGYSVITATNASRLLNKFQFIFLTLFFLTRICPESVGLKHYQE